MEEIIQKIPPTIKKEKNKNKNMLQFTIKS